MRSDKILYRKKRITIYLSRIVTKLLLHYNFFHNLLHKEKEKKKQEWINVQLCVMVMLFIMGA